MLQIGSKVPMLAHTHGQPASPSRLGKEITGIYRTVRKSVEFAAAWYPIRQSLAVLPVTLTRIMWVTPKPTGKPSAINL